MTSYQVLGINDHVKAYIYCIKTQTIMLKMWHPLNCNRKWFSWAVQFAINLIAIMLTTIGLVAGWN